MVMTAVPESFVNSESIVQPAGHFDLTSGAEANYP